MIGISVNRFEDGCRELLTKLLALMVDVAIGTSTEIDALERTTCLLLSLQDRFH